MIDKTGQITINDDQLAISNFVFNYDCSFTIELMKQDLKEYICKIIDEVEITDDLTGITFKEKE